MIQYPYFQVKCLRLPSDVYTSLASLRTEIDLSSDEPSQL